MTKKQMKLSENEKKDRMMNDLIPLFVIAITFMIAIVLIIGSICYEVGKMTNYEYMVSDGCICKNLSSTESDYLDDLMIKRFNIVNYNLTRMNWSNYTYCDKIHNRCD